MGKGSALEKIKGIIKEHQGEMAFIIGNGINRYSGHLCQCSWSELLIKLIRDFTNLGIDHIPDGVTMTELYHIIEHQCDRERRKQIPLEIAEHLRNWQCATQHNEIVRKIQDYNIPILTTNYDELLSKAVKTEKLTFNKRSHRYPWGYYFSNQKLHSPLAGFGIWHINGMISYPGSISLGLAHYMGMVKFAYNILHKSKESPFSDSKNNGGRDWKGYYTWLNIIFNKSLFIFGLGLNEQEVFLRWLLLRRYRWFERYPQKMQKSWYVYSGDEGMLEGKKLFFKATGIEPIKLENREDLYENLWKII